MKPNRRKPTASRRGKAANGPVCKPHYLTIATEDVAREYVAPGEVWYTWVIADTSMAPDFLPGDFVMAFPNLRPEKGNLVVVRDPKGVPRLVPYKTGMRKTLVGVVVEHWRKMHFGDQPRSKVSEAHL